MTRATDRGSASVGAAGPDGLPVAAAASFLTSVATPANMMVMGPGGYRFGDYWKARAADVDPVLRRGGLPRPRDLVLLNVSIRRAVFVLTALLAVVVSPAITLGSTADENALAQKFAPVVRLVEQTEACGRGESYTPLDVDLLFGEPTVGLSGPWSRQIVTVAPTAEDIAGLYRYHLDFPGDATNPGCDFEQWERRLTAGGNAAAYAHVATEAKHPGKLALQYWFFYVYNDWNNLHEGDWEMIQLTFDADSAAQALTQTPTDVGYSQHSGGEATEWEDRDTLEIVDGTHPVVHPAAGSHANFFGEALYLGSSTTEGVGCDDTRGAGPDLRPTVFTIPSDKAEAAAKFPWITFEGRWGELQPAFFNGPTGPNMKDSWTEPITWSQDLRRRSIALPSAGTFGTSTTDFFCTAIGGGSRALQRFLHAPLQVGIVIAVIVLLLLYLLRRTRWRPTAPLELARRRAWGQILAAAARMYVRKAPLFIGIGLLLIPIAFLLAFLQAGVFHASSFLGVSTEAGGGGFFVGLLLAFGTLLTLLGVGLVQAATAEALLRIDRGETVDPVSAYKLALPNIRPLVIALLIAIVVVSVIASTFILIPIAIWFAIRWALIVPVIVVEDRSAGKALRRSGLLVQGHWLKVGSLIILGGAIALAIGPLLGLFLILLTSAPFWLVNVIGGIVNAVLVPYVALTTAYVYFDTRARAELEPDRNADVLPAEFELTARPHP
jgi:hypothetical protein